jgi:hypothetical protein
MNHHLYEIGRPGTRLVGSAFDLSGFALLPLRNKSTLLTLIGTIRNANAKA